MSKTKSLMKEYGIVITKKLAKVYDFDVKEALQIVESLQISLDKEIPEKKENQLIVEMDTPICQACIKSIKKKMKLLIETDTAWNNDYGRISDKFNSETCEYLAKYESEEDYLIYLFQDKNKVITFKILPSYVNKYTRNFLENPGQFDGFFYPEPKNTDPFCPIPEIKGIMERTCDMKNGLQNYDETSELCLWMFDVKM